MVGMFIENGPYKVNMNRVLRDNPNSWNKIANMLYIDNVRGPWPRSPSFAHILTLSSPSALDSRTRTSMSQLRPRSLMPCMRVRV